MTENLFLLPPVDRQEASAPTGRTKSIRGSDRMSGDEVDTRPGATSRPGAPSRRVWIRRGVLGCAAVLVLTVGWVGVRGGLAANAAFSGAGEAARLGSLLADGNTAGARLVIPAVQAKAQEAHELTSDPIWRIVEAAPFLGGNLLTVRKSFTAFAGIADDGIGPLIDLSDGRAEELLAQSPAERRVNIVKLTPAITALSDALHSAVTTVSVVDADHNIPALGDSFVEAQKALGSYAFAAEAAAQLAVIVPSLLTEDGGHEWTVTVTAPGADGPTEIALLRASTAGGTFSVVEALSAGPAPTPDQRSAVGALTIDISSFRYLLEKTGPISVPGVGEITADTVDDVTSTGLYAQASSATEADALVGSVAGTLIGALLN